jgi:hypothetical protein
VGGDLVFRFRDGAPVHAEGVGIPDLGERLVARGRLSPAAWQRISARGAPPVGEALVAADVVSPAELDGLVRALLVDALLTLALRTDHVEVRAAGGTDPLGWRAPASLDDLLAEAAGLADLLRSAGIGPGTVLGRGPAPELPVVLTQAQWGVVWRADGRTTARDHCRATGRGTAEILLAMLGLVTSGVCTARPETPAPPEIRAPADEPTVTYSPPEAKLGTTNEPAAAEEPPAEPATAAEAPAAGEAPAEGQSAVTSEAPALGQAAGGGDDSGVDALPQRRRGSTVWDLRTRGDEAGAKPVSDPVEPPDLDVVRRILRGLRDL